MPWRLADLLERILPMLEERAGAERVIDYLPAEELKNALALDLPEQGLPGAALFDALRAVLRHSPKSSHPLYLDKLYAGTEPVGQVAELVSTVVNLNVHTYDTAPPLTLLERSVIAGLAARLGYDSEQSDGLLYPGGAVTNLAALIVARHAHFPEADEAGIDPSVGALLFCSEQAHYSHERAAVITGLGRRAVRTIACDEAGRMRVDALADALDQAVATGARPFYVAATAGTTVLGAIDPLRELAELCAGAGAWLHVDGCLGASLAMSDRHRGLLAGIEQADSVAWNVHKMLGVPLQCSALLTRRRGVLEAANASAASYLYHDGGGLDIGEKSLQCGRKSDALKLWMTWLAYGRQGFARRVDEALARVQRFVEMLAERAAFRLVVPPASVNVCAWFLPPSLRELPAAEQLARLPDTTTGTICGRLRAEGSALVDYASLPGDDRPGFFRFVLHNPSTTDADLARLLDRIEAVGADL